MNFNPFVLCILYFNAFSVKCILSSYATNCFIIANKIIMHLMIYKTYLNARRKKNLWCLIMIDLLGMFVFNNHNIYTPTI